MKQTTFTVLSSTRTPLILLMTILVLWSASMLFMSRGHAGDWVDDGFYFVGAQSLHQGLGYTLTSRPGTPFITRYPPGLSVLGALALTFTSADTPVDHAYKIARSVVVLGGVIFFLACWVWLRRSWENDWLALLIILSVMWHPTVVDLSLALMSDVPFSAVCLVLFARWAREREKTTRGYFIDGILAGAGWLIRMNGLTLILAVIIASGLTRKWRCVMATIAGITLLVIPTILYMRSHATLVAESDYAVSLRSGWSSPAAALTIIAPNLKSFANNLVFAVAPFTTHIFLVVRFLEAFRLANFLMKIFVLFLIVVGSVYLLRKITLKQLPLLVHIASTFGLLMVWPYRSDLRLILNLLPIILLTFITGVWIVIQFSVKKLSLLHGAQGRRFVTVCIALICVIVLSPLLITGVALAKLWRHHGVSSDSIKSKDAFDEALRHVSSETGRDAIIVAESPETIYLYTGRQSLPLLEIKDWMYWYHGDKANINADNLSACVRDNLPRKCFLLKLPIVNYDLKIWKLNAIMGDPRLKRVVVWSDDLTGCELISLGQKEASVER